MSQAADLEQLFQLEQILSLRSPEGKRCDKYETLEQTPSACETSDIKGSKLGSDAITNQEHVPTTTSFDPGGKAQSSIQEGNQEESNVHKKKEASGVLLNKALTVQNTNCNTNSVSSSCNAEEEILSYAASSCGRALVFIALTGKESKTSPQLGSVVLKPALQCSSHKPEATKNEKDFDDLADCNVGTNVSVYWMSWFDNGDGASDALTCVTLRKQDNLCLVSCRDGSLYLLPPDIVFPEFHTYCSSTDFERTSTNNGCYSQLSSENIAKIPNEIFAIPTPLHHRRANPTALIFWTTSELNLAIVGTRSGQIVAVDLNSGKEVSYYIDFSCIAIGWNVYQ